MTDELNVEKELILKKIFTDMTEKPFEWEWEFPFDWEWESNEYEYMVRGNLKIKFFKGAVSTLFLDINREDFSRIKGAEKVVDACKRLQNKLRVNGINEEIKGWSK